MISPTAIMATGAFTTKHTKNPLSVSCGPHKADRASPPGALPERLRLPGKGFFCVFRVFRGKRLQGKLTIESESVNSNPCWRGVSITHLLSARRRQYIYPQFTDSDHCCPVKLPSKGKNHRETKIPFPFPSLDLQLDENRITLLPKGVGAYLPNWDAHARTSKKALPMTAGKKLLTTLPCFCRRSARHSFYRTAVDSDISPTPCPPRGCRIALLQFYGDHSPVACRPGLVRCPHGDTAKS